MKEGFRKKRKEGNSNFSKSKKMNPIGSLNTDRRDLDFGDNSVYPSKRKDARRGSQSLRRSWSVRMKQFFGVADDDQETYVPPPVLEGRKTLILDLDETLIHSADYPPHNSVQYFLSGEPSFYVYKRPGLDDFLRMITEKFDVFIFTFGDREYAEPVLDELCPFIDNDHRLYRDLCEIKSGKQVRKDLTLFQRSKKEIILVDDNINALHFNPKNTIQIERWLGMPSDRALIDWLPPILDECAAADDVRTVITRIPNKSKKKKSKK
ncbi:CTD small phosphatase-like protein [Tritrichomonas foetus]|uniref:Mitochondrial import inner membrane translocase subunit TIM50 n=1 Tax=Tritrichomonas foetus TaxID=1144522 RepID=A0A1J4KMI7_9EUKA|nr:CTD small phosphatase-like protein [Tritrichomonas foetus]|eukprot:OHT11012.1 CTD small phosphatase-like protein [Tritrichomonas foetus]